MFRDAAVVHDERGSDATLLAVLLVVVDLDDSDTAPVGKLDRVTVDDRVAFVSDDPYLSTGHVDEAKTCHRGLILA